jgi:hypothetical protein
MPIILRSAWRLADEAGTILLDGAARRVEPPGDRAS